MGKKSTHKKQHRQNQPASPKQAQPQQARSKPMELASLTKDGVTLPVESSAPVKPLGFGEQTDYVRPDVRRIGILLLAVAILLVAAVVWNSKSSALFTAGKHMASFMQLQH